MCPLYTKEMVTVASAEVPLAVTKNPRRQEQQGQGCSGRKNRDDVRTEGGSTLAKGEHFLSRPE